ncbi:MAG: cytochrome c oxidase accessory protein CcoG [Bacteroidetes bacterium]|nr:cytochrome c oxidase accessory protein CcoG [Bacteroidota bacterium]
MSNEDSSYRDHLATVDQSGKRKWIYANKPSGTYYKWRSIVSYIYFIIFFGLPFLYWNGHPVFMINIPKGKYIIFGKIFWSQDFFIFGLSMIIFIILIALFTAAFGRLFCGWVCPQTNFMEMMFRKVEYWIEGSASDQKKLNESPWTNKKIFIKTVKHLSFYILAFIIANFFLSYIIGIEDLWHIISDPVELHTKGLISIMLFSGIFYGVYAFFREQACTVVCPYGRLQSMMIDKNSMIVAYDYKRGEPKGKNDGTHGDCIDCNLCVKVCQTGIDIRNGLQMECVGCTACIDACDNVMSKIGKPNRLIRYASENTIANGTPFVLTKRMKLYSLLILILASVLSFVIISQEEVEITVMRTPGLLFQEVGKDSVSNLYNIKLLNKTYHQLSLSAHLTDDIGVVKIMGADAIRVNKEDQGAATVFVTLPKNYISKRKSRIKLSFYNGHELVHEVTTNFIGPVSK